MQLEIGILYLRARSKRSRITIQSQTLFLLPDAYTESSNCSTVRGRGWAHKRHQTESLFYFVRLTCPATPYVVAFQLCHDLPQALRVFSD